MSMLSEEASLGASPRTYTVPSPGTVDLADPNLPLRVMMASLAQLGPDAEEAKLAAGRARLAALGSRTPHPASGSAGAERVARSAGTDPVVVLAVGFLLGLVVADLLNPRPLPQREHIPERSPASPMLSTASSTGGMATGGTDVGRTPDNDATAVHAPSPGCGSSVAAVHDR